MFIKLQNERNAAVVGRMNTVSILWESPLFFPWGNRFLLLPTQGKLEEEGCKGVQ